MNINEYHGTFNRTKRSGGVSAIKYFVVHYTAGTGSAKNNCIYFSGGDRGASADWFVDKDGSVWEYNDPKSGYYTWAVGDGKGKYGITNSNSVHAEVVNNGDAFTGEQVKALNALYNHACDITGTKLTVVRHYDASRKSCPAYYTDQTRWNSLKSQIEQREGWVKDSKGWWYRYADGSWPKSRWIKLDAWYYFNAEGYALTSCWKKINGYWYYFGSDCRMQTGWKKIKNKWYYLHPKKEKDHKGAEWPEGSAHIGWIKTNGKWYYCNKASEGTECAMREGWLDWEGGRYYLKPGNGDMACNETMTIDGKSYTFDNSGAMK